MIFFQIRLSSTAMPVVRAPPGRHGAAEPPGPGTSDYEPGPAGRRRGPPRARPRPGTRSGGAMPPAARRQCQAQAP